MRDTSLIILSFCENELLQRAARQGRRSQKREGKTNKNPMKFSTNALFFHDNEYFCVCVSPRSGESERARERARAKHPTRKL
mgnify:CR=1 FL=1